MLSTIFISLTTSIHHNVTTTKSLMKLKTLNDKNCKFISSINYLSVPVCVTEVGFIKSHILMLLNNTNRALLLKSI